MLKKITFIILIVALFPFTGLSKKLNVVTTTEDLADIAKSIGGERVDVKSLSKGYLDIHFVEPKPSMVVMMKKADLLIRVGMDLDMWVQPIIDKAGNSKVLFGSPGYIDVSKGISPLEVPKEKVDWGMGDIHIFGNPHFWLSPENGKIIARNILDGLKSASPEDSNYFEKNYDAFIKNLEGKIVEWKGRMERFRGTKVVVYHNSWPYLAQFLGFIVIGHIEPKPGIPPNPFHISSLIRKMKEENAKLIFVEPYLDPKPAFHIAKETGVKVLILPTSVNGLKGVSSYISIFDYIVEKIVEALEE